MVNVNQVLDKEIVQQEVKARSLARRLGVSDAALSHYRKGVRNVPADVAARAATCLCCPELLQAFCSGCPVSNAWREFKARRRAA